MAWRNRGDVATTGGNAPLTVVMVGWVPDGLWITPARPQPILTVLRQSPMAHFLERMVWMPSPPLAPDCGPADHAIDLDHLGRMTFGDPGLEREVLAMFAAQASELAERLTNIPPDAANLAHTLKGSARAIGASRVAEAAADLEAAARSGAATAAAVTALRDAVAEARGVIDAILRRS